MKAVPPQRISPLDCRSPTKPRHFLITSGTRKLMSSDGQRWYLGSFSHPYINQITGHIYLLSRDNYRLNLISLLFAYANSALPVFPFIRTVTPHQMACLPPYTWSFPGHRNPFPVEIRSCFSST